MKPHSESGVLWVTIGNDKSLSLAKQKLKVRRQALYQGCYVPAAASDTIKSNYRART